MRWRRVRILWQRFDYTSAPQQDQNYTLRIRVGYYAHFADLRLAMQLYADSGYVKITARNGHHYCTLAHHS